MKSATQAVGKLATACAAAGAVYAVVLGILLTPRAQRLYANAFNTLRWRDVHDGTAHGFAPNQVTPFNLSTPDGETLYAWHILPLDQYTRHETAILNEAQRRDGPVDDFTSTTAYKVLTSRNPSPAKVVVSFHGNAGHIAQGWRPAANRLITNMPDTHVFTIDYRGFGHSTGTPTEAGLIADGVALVEYIMETTKIPPEQIVILGQSLGTAVSAAVALHFADRRNALLPPLLHTSSLSHASDQKTPPTTFAGVVLAAPFNSIPTLLLTYRIGGFLPLLLPLRPFPTLAQMLMTKVVDKWQTADRLWAYYHALEGTPNLNGGTRDKGSVQIIHALNDADIPFHQTEMIYKRVFSQRKSQDAFDTGELEPSELIAGNEGPAVFDVKKDGFPRMRFDFVEHGGHNRILTYSPVAVAISRALEGFSDS
ncbi:hypothetical protein CKM354_000367900 [Cercospora kikuchii]|uniref:AB hydrolase-1 domain-containing protein n=1 Tax=Cercospora kikuchii TaxID=84275 RepID=A0A9P3FFB3_9PEZI|nr:uncharacterized protein CKM354_000367900 [Cercospora kikuchii]GIZ40335.1 hypothetical protein CKM354_000367900 [Cercospora kikuchii]